MNSKEMILVNIRSSMTLKRYNSLSQMLLGF